MKFILPICVILGLGFTLAKQAEARIFRNAYISFEMPETWKCVLEQTEWVCRSEQAQTSKEAIIILTAKEVGLADSFPLYRQHLDTPISVNMRGGGTGSSKVVTKAKDVRIENQPWLDALHIGSEVPNYYTRYLATIKDKIAILVTFSVHKNYYQKYSQDFFRAVQSLRVIATKNLMSRPELGQMKMSGEPIGPPSAAFPKDIMIDDPGVQPAPPKSNKGFFLLLAVIGMAVGGWLFMKSKMGSKGPKNKK